MSAKLPSPQPSQGDIRTACSEASQICMRSPPSLARIALLTMVLPAITSTMMPTTKLIATKTRTRSGRERQRPRSINTVRAASPAGEDQRHGRHHAHAAVAAERIAADEGARHHAASRRRVVGTDLLEVAAEIT